MQAVRTNEDGSPNLSDLHRLLDDLEWAGRILYLEKSPTTICSVDKGSEICSNIVEH